MDENAKKFFDNSFFLYVVIILATGIMKYFNVVSPDESILLQLFTIFAGFLVIGAGIILVFTFIMLLFTGLKRLFRSTKLIYIITIIFCILFLLFI